MTNLTPKPGCRIKYPKPVCPAHGCEMYFRDSRYLDNGNRMVSYYCAADGCEVVLKLEQPPSERKLSLSSLSPQDIALPLADLTPDD